MMKRKSTTLRVLYNDIICHKRNLWNYYNESMYIIQLNDIKDLSNQAKSFINCYLRRGGKGDIPFFVENIEKLDSDRINHVVSCFFLGMVIYSNCGKIKSSILRAFDDSNTLCESVELRFSYIWFLVCLFHDLGYAVENDFPWAEKKKDDFDKYYKIFPKKPSGIPCVFTKSLLKKYMSWRICCNQRYDHGVIGGINLFHDLCQYRCNVVDTFGLADSGFVKEGLYWGKDLEKDYSFAAWVIACHNIWLTQESNDNARCYRCFHMDKLIRDSPVINIDRHPILFLFCLADSLEPIKNLKDVCLYDRIRISFGYNSIQFNLDALTDEEKLIYSKQIASIYPWLVSKKNISDNDLIIEL